MHAVVAISGLYVAVVVICIVIVIAVGMNASGASLAKLLLAATQRLQLPELIDLFVIIVVVMLSGMWDLCFTLL